MPRNKSFKKDSIFYGLFLKIKDKESRKQKGKWELKQERIMKRYETKRIKIEKLLPLFIIIRR